ncbi:putative haloacid dehalogenase-like hydrolase [Rosellinia necatrix]|uniref:Putative haloacid dehalogenase-like hydrolase n=1 Tax=Rosellinia necatrix TaxID=77044 RepID=A0A1S7UIL2_ROSNE|nr:putative haloacid dehalogenase-like hydrolase [Rosellinia necatrix]
MSKTAPRRFAPLKTTPGQEDTGLPKLQGIIFDVDGTLCLPQNYMFAQMRAALQIPASSDILAHVASLPAGARPAAMAAVRAIERAAMAAQEPQPGLGALMGYLRGRGVRRALCTRNFDQPVAHLLAKFLPGHVFAPVVTRDFDPPKPAPAGLLFIARSWGLVRRVDEDGEGKGNDEGDAAAAAAGNGEGWELGDASALIMVGDSIDDMTAGRRAGAATVLLVNPDNAHLAEHPHTDLVIRSLDELVGVLEDGFVGREIPISTP